MLELMNKSKKANLLILGIWAMGILFGASAFLNAVANFISAIN